MRTFDNICDVTGVLYDCDVKEAVNKKGKEYIAGKITIRVHEEVSGKMETSDIEVNVYANKYKNDNTLNPSYTSICEVRDTYRRIVACGSEDLADRISISASGLRFREYYSKKGTFIQLPNVTASFFKRVDKTEKEQAHFTTTVYIQKMYMEHNRAGEETGRMVLEAAIPEYAGLTCGKFYLENPQTIDYVANNYCPKATVTLQGKIRFIVKEQVKTTDKDSFMDCKEFERKFTQKSQELVMYTGSREIFDEGSAYTEDEIVEGLALRSAALERLKEKTPASQTPKTIAPAISPNDDF